MEQTQIIPIIRHWNWFYEFLNNKLDVSNFTKEELYFHSLKDNWGWDTDLDGLFLRIIRSKKLILVNNYGQRVRIVPEHFIYVTSSDIDDVMSFVKGKGIKKEGYKWKNCIVRRAGK